MALSCESPAPLSPNTVYFEIDSSFTGDRYGIWVILPPAYTRKADQSFPALYVTDGNTNALLAAAASFLLFGDHLRPVRPFVQVCIGFADDKDIGARFVRRARDFVPPGERFASRLERHLSLPAYASALGPTGQEAMVEAFAKGGADDFLAFIEKELHPEIERRFRVKPSGAGLFGHSQGGLFSLYVMLRGSPLFETFGAGSPALNSSDSVAYGLYRDLVARTGPEGRPIRLHILMNDGEMMGPTELYRALAINFVRFIDMVKGNPLPGLAMTSTVIRGENHFSGVFDAYRDFLRACYALPRRDGLS